MLPNEMSLAPKVDKTQFIVIDPGANTGWAVWNKDGFVTSGVISTQNEPVNKQTYLATKIEKLITTYHPQKAYMEKLYSFTRRAPGGNPKNVRALQINAGYWKRIEEVFYLFGVPLTIIDTRKLAKKKLAQAGARQITGKKRISTHEAEAVVWGHHIHRRGL